MALWTQYSQRIFRFGPFEVDQWTGELRKGGKKLKIQDQPLKVLAMLLARPGELVTREELRQGLWSNHTFVDFDSGLNAAVKRLRAALKDSAEHPRFVETVGRRGYRFIAPVTIEGSAKTEAALRSASSGSVYEWPSTSPSMTPVPTEEAEVTGFPRSSKQTAERLEIRNQRHWLFLVAVLMLLSAAVIVTGVYHRSLSGKQINHRNTIVLADFANTTGDMIFNDTLRQGLSVQLEQSPFFSLVPDVQIEQTLRMMGRAADTRLEPAVAHEVCQRTGSAVMIAGSIGQIGGDYDLIVRAVNCQTGTALASAEARAMDKKRVLDALSQATSQIRSKLGESLASVRKYDTPIWQATTPSLEALQAFSLAQKRLLETGDDTAALPFVQRAVELDPGFALAHSIMSVVYLDLGETAKAKESATRAYELRNGVSENEKLMIEGNYHYAVTGDLMKARRAFEVGARTFPGEPFFPNLLGPVSIQLGEYQRALAECREGLRVEPWNAEGWSNLVFAYVAVNRVPEAEDTAGEAQKKGFDNPDDLYSLAFLRNDNSGMAKQAARTAGTSREDWFLAREADTAAFFGRLGAARMLSRQAIDSATRSERKEAAATYAVIAALREALFGNSAQARWEARSALAWSSGRDAEYGAALALAYAGDAMKARQLAEELNQRFPEDTVVQFNYLPTLRARLALSGAGKEGAEDLLRAAAPYELGSPATYNWTALYPVYVRGEAALAARQGLEAETEFRKILDHPGVVQNEPIGALAHLGLARAYRLQGDTIRARVTYQDFLSLWKDADRGIPVINQATAEHNNLK